MPKFREPPLKWSLSLVGGCLSLVGESLQWSLGLVGGCLEGSLRLVGESLSWCLSLVGVPVGGPSASWRVRGLRRFNRASLPVGADV